MAKFEARYTEEEKVAALKEAEKEGWTDTVLAAKMEVTPRSIRHWRAALNVVPTVSTEAKELAAQFDSLAAKAIHMAGEKLKKIKLDDVNPKTFVEMASQAVQTSRLLKGESTSNPGVAPQVESETEKLSRIAGYLLNNPDFQSAALAMKNAVPDTVEAEAVEEE